MQKKPHKESISAENTIKYPKNKGNKKTYWMLSNHQNHKNPIKL